MIVETTGDGCPVEVYAVLPSEPDLSRISAFIDGRTRVLDLGAGAGRIADPLAQAGHVVLAVDESAEMLARVRHARTAQSRIESLSIPDRFDAVLLLSHLVNTPDSSARRQLLMTVARHLDRGGLAVIQRHDPAHRFRPGRASIGAVTVALGEIDDARWPSVSAVSTYEFEGQSYDQRWEAFVLDDPDTESALADVGLRPVQISGPWVTAISALP